MPKPRNKIKIGSYVQLREGYDQTDLYRLVEAGATAWVKDSKVDDGFAMIFVEWDENNPNYSGEKNKWVYESHFKVLADEESIMEEYISAIKRATDGALVGEAFLMISVSRVIHPVTGEATFKPVIISSDLNDKASYVLEAQIVYAAGQLFNDYIRETLDLIEEDDIKEDIEEDKDESGR